MNLFNRSRKPLSYSQAVVELVLAGIFWGLGFVAAVWALRMAGPMAITGWRFLFAGIVGAFFIGRSLFSSSAGLLFGFAWVPGLLIGTTIIFQTWGLLFTTATKSSFITCLYVLIVPLLEPFFGGHRPSRRTVVCVLLALVGVALMCGLFSERELDARSNLNVGDLLTLVCAFAASVHIIMIGKVHAKLGPYFNGFNFNTAQSLCAGLPSLLIALVIEPNVIKMPIHLVEVASQGSALPLIGFLSLTILSTLIGFALQVRAQRVLSPSTAALLFLLEAPFALLFAAIFLGERLGNLQMIGGALILTSVIYNSIAQNTSTVVPQ